MTTITITSSDTWSTPRRRKHRDATNGFSLGSQQTPSADLLSSLPPLSALQTWVQRPQAIAKCSISDLYQMRALVPSGVDHNAYRVRDVFLLNRLPCRMLEIVAWVAGVDHKETSMTVTVDDGDGQHVLPVIIRLSLQTHNPAPGTTKQSTSESSTTFLSARQRKAQRKAAVEAAGPAMRRLPTKVYVRKDVRVGDTVRIVGRVDDWGRKKANGELEWVRQLVVEEGSGGSIIVVDEDAQYKHNAQVSHLHKTLYSRPFSVPSASSFHLAASQPSSPVKSVTYSEGMEPSSELGSEFGMEVDPTHIKLRDPSKLSSSQLTDATFRQYLLDYITQETTKSLQEAGPSVPFVLEQLFPEYAEAVHGKGKGKARVVDPFTPSTKDNYAQQGASTFRSRKSRSATPLSVPLVEPFTISSIVNVPHLAQLARLVVDNEAKKEERRRRRRIKDGVPRPRDLAVEVERKKRGLDAKEWRLSETERFGKMEKLIAWVIRGVAEEGGVIQFSLPFIGGGLSGTRSKCDINTERFGYLPIPPPLLLPLLLPMITAEGNLRKDTILRKGDPRRGNGMTIEQMMVKLQGWGVEGRWERVKEWVIQDAISWGVERGYLRAEGRGWWVAEMVAARS